MKMDHDQINIAVNLLKSQGLAVTSPRVADLTGYNQARLYQSGLLSPYLRKRSRKAKITPREVVKEQLSHTLDSYLCTLKEGYFARPEKLEDVQVDMALNFADFNPSLFTQAVNILTASGTITETHHGYVMSHESQPTSNMTKPNYVDAQFMVLNTEDGTVYWIDTHEELEAKITSLSQSPLVKLKVFKANEIVEVSRKKLH